MRVLLLNTSERTGGAAIAANRLMDALSAEDIRARMLVRDKTTNDRKVVALEPSWRLKWNFVWERACIWWANWLHKHRLFEVDICNTGTDITMLPEFRQADIIHIHWINQGFLSLKNIQAIIQSGKPIVWTMHDMWPFTGICHYTQGCEKYLTECHNCPILWKGSKNDLSRRIFRKKMSLLSHANIQFVGCSDWLSDMARASRMLGNRNIWSIPNAINTNLYHPISKHESRVHNNLPEDRHLLLFAAFKITNKIKGIDYLCKAIEILTEAHPDMKDKLGLVAVGQEAEALQERISIPVYPMGYITDEHRMVELYNAVDLFLIPTLQDNLPNTIVEAMACAVPCIGFNVGGLPQMIDHLHNGYIARYKDASDFANGIYWALTDGNYAELSEMALRKAVESYSEHSIARQYIEVYNLALSQSANQ